MYSTSLLPMRYSAGVANSSAGTDSRFCVARVIEISLGVIGISSTRLLSLAPWRVMSPVLRYWPGKTCNLAKRYLPTAKEKNYES
jgi:hypothetical protein